MINRRQFVSGLAGAGILISGGQLLQAKSEASDIERIRKRYIERKPNSILHCFEHMEVKPEDIVKTTHFNGYRFHIKKDTVWTKILVPPILSHLERGNLNVCFPPDYKQLADFEHKDVIIPLYGDNIPVKEREADALDLIKAAGNRLVSKLEFPLTSDYYYDATNLLIKIKDKYTHVLCNNKHRQSPGQFGNTNMKIIGLPEIDENTVYLTTKSELIYLTEGNRIGFACLDENSIETIHFSQ